MSTLPSQMCLDLAQAISLYVQEVERAASEGNQISSFGHASHTMQIAKAIHDVQTEAVHAAIGR